jgi:CRISPR-associated protein Cmr5
MGQTLDQKRAQYAWNEVSRTRQQLGGKFKDYRNLSKGAPAMIMGSGLMAALAYYRAKSSESAQLVTHVLGWLATRGLKSDFAAAMQALQASDSQFYMQQTEEALAILRWIRQFADALNEKASGERPG